MFRNIFDGWHIVILVLLIVIIFGWKRLPDAARSLGRSARILKSEVDDFKAENNAKSKAAGQTVPGQTAPQQSAYPQQGQYQQQGQYPPPQQSGSPQEGQYGPPQESPYSAQNGYPQADQSARPAEPRTHTDGTSPGA